MERNSRQAALQQLLSIASEQGYIVFDDIMRCADENALSIGDFDWLSNAVNMRNILVYDEAPDVGIQDDDYEDYSHDDYEAVFHEVIRSCPEAEPLIVSVRNIIPPQRGEVRRLMLQVAEGNQHARNRMVEMYLRQAIKIAFQRASVFSLDIMETIGDAVVGLITAVDRYNPSTSGPFNSYASLWMLQNISREQRTQNKDLYYPAGKKENYYSAFPLLKKRGCIECGEFINCDKAIDMVCYDTDCNRKEATEIVTACLPCLSWETDVAEREDVVQFIFSDEDFFEDIYRRLESDQLRNIINTLSERQREVIIERNGLDDGIEKTLEEISLRYGVTRERIRQIEKNAMHRLKYLCRKMQ